VLIKTYLHKQAKILPLFLQRNEIEKNLIPGHFKNQFRLMKCKIKFSFKGKRNYGYISPKEKKV
jgi:hypothetical protein